MKITKNVIISVVAAFAALAVIVTIVIFSNQSSTDLATQEANTPVAPVVEAAEVPAVEVSEVAAPVEEPKNWGNLPSRMWKSIPSRKQVGEKAQDAAVWVTSRAFSADFAKAPKTTEAVVTPAENEAEATETVAEKTEVVAEKAAEEKPANTLAPKSVQ